MITFKNESKVIFMKQEDILFKELEKNNGIISSKEAVSLGVRKNIFSELIKKEKLIKIANGLYALPNEEIDEYMYFMHRIPQGIFSHDTALYLNGLSTRMPLVYTMTVKSGYNVSRIKERGQSINFKYISEELIGLGKIQLKNPYGRKVYVYNKERSILDIIRDKNNIDTQIFNESLNLYFKSSEKNILRLSEYALKMNMEKALRTYTEVLL